MNVRREPPGVRGKIEQRKAAYPADAGALRLMPRVSRGFTLIEVLVSVTIFAVVMSILYGTYSASSASARAVEEKADEVSSISGAVDTLSREIRGAYLTDAESAAEVFSGKEKVIAFTTTAPFVREGEPVVQRVSYIFDNDRLIRKTLHSGSGTEIKNEAMLLDGIKEPSFSFFDGKGWVAEWPSEKGLPAGVRVIFYYKGRDMENIIPVWSSQRW